MRFCILQCLAEQIRKPDNRYFNAWCEIATNQLSQRTPTVQRYIDPQRNSAVNTYLTTFNDRRHAAYATLSPQERRRQERRDRRTLQHIRYEHSLRVRAGYVELHDGQPMRMEEAQLARDAWVKQRKQRKQRNQGNDASRTVDNTASAPAEPTISNDDGKAPAVQERGDRPVRHRRLAPRGQETASMAPSPTDQHAA